MEIPSVPHQNKPLTWQDLQTVLEIQQGFLVPPQLQELCTSPNEREQPDLLEHLHFWQETLWHGKTPGPGDSILQTLPPSSQQAEPGQQSG